MGGEITAFANSNGGVILIGVDDDNKWSRTCSLFLNSNVTDVISGAGHAHCFRTVM
jgi:predicted HTH transcriptional regulator